MNAPVSLVAVADAPTSLVSIVEANPALVLLEPAKFDQFFDEVAREVRSHVPDVSTDKGRKAIASLAYKVSTTKTAIEAARELLTKEKRDEIKAVDAAGKAIRDRLDALRDEAKKPLLDWQAAETARIARCEEVMAAIKRDGVIGIEDTSATVSGRHDLVKSVEITPEQFGEYFDMATMLKTNAVEALERGYARLVKEEADRAELARLREAEEERLQREAEAQAAAQEAARAARAAEEEKERARAQQAAEDARVAAAARAAEEAARAQAERAAAEARETQERAHAEALAAEKRRADLAEAARKSEADAARMIEEERARATAAQAAEQAKREADVVHKSKIMAAAKDALIALGISEPKAKTIVMAIKAGEIPNVSIAF